MSFGSRIKALRISKGLMQKDIAKYLNTLSSEDMIFINKIAKCLLSEKNRI